jgi:phage shock protein PspC (stress-responsive transcriptional regulator)
MSRTLTKKLMWFVAIWLLSVATLTVVAYAIKWAIL